MSDLYTGNGNKIIVGGGEVSPEAVKEALVDAVASGDISMGSAVGATLKADTPVAWNEKAASSYQKLLAAYRKIPQVGVPFFISTDQHGRGLDQHRWLNNNDVDGMEMANLNLGDTCTDYYESFVMKKMYDRTWQVKNYASVPGNHDYAKHNETVDHLLMCRCFQCTSMHYRDDNILDCYTMTDFRRKVKYIMCDFYADAGYVISGMAYPYVTTDTADWLIKELSADDGYDVIVCTHEPIVNTCRDRTKEEETGPDGFETRSLFVATPKLRKLMEDRKNKAVGTYTDDASGPHPYDFSKCQSDLLCTLHGHTHYELWSTANGLATYVADWYGDNEMCCYGLVDRAAKTLTIWAFNSVKELEPLVLQI